MLSYTLGLDKINVPMCVLCICICAHLARVINIDIELFVYIKEEYSRNHCVDYLNERSVGLLEEVIIQIESGNVCETIAIGIHTRRRGSGGLRCGIVYRVYITTKVVHTVCSNINRMSI